MKSIGIGAFGPIVLDRESENYGLLISESKKGWEGTNLFTEFRNSFDLMINIDTDVNTAAIGEYSYGAGQGCQTLVYITIGTGIGGGVLISGKPLVGNFHLDMGHMLVSNLDNFLGVCRIHGDCWEGLASGPSMEARWGIPPLELPEAHEAWEGLWIASVRNSSEHRFLQGLIKCGAALLKIRMAKYEILDLIGARNLARSGIDLLSKVGTDQFMGLDIPKFLKAYQNFVIPIYDNKIPVIDRKTPRIKLMI